MNRKAQDIPAHTTTHNVSDLTILFILSKDEQCF